MNDLAATFASLVRTHVATLACPLPEPTPGITWIVAANGVFKRGVDQHRDLLIRVGPLGTPFPGLTSLLPHARWPGQPCRIPGVLLRAVLTHARKAAAPAGGGLLRPIEQQYHITLERGALRVRVPLQDATPGRVAYAMPDGAVLVDLHSHHGMQAYFSDTDDRDDVGLSVSLVLGTIFTRPTLAARLNVFGHRQQIDPCLIFDDIAPLIPAARHSLAEDPYAAFSAS